MRLISTSLLIIAALALASCSVVNTIYNNAPSLAASEFDDAFDLTDEQLEQLDRDLQRFFEWHRREELPRYRKFLASASVTIADGTGPVPQISSDQLLRDELERLLWRDFAAVHRRRHEHDRLA